MPDSPTLDELKRNVEAVRAEYRKAYLEYHRLKDLYEDAVTAWIKADEQVNA